MKPDIKYPMKLMWDMTQDELEAYATIADKKDYLPGAVMEKYGLTVYARPPASYLPIPPTHWLVCRWLESHPDEQEQYGQPGSMYYDILDKAEQEYLNLPPREERTRQASET